MVDITYKQIDQIIILLKTYKPVNIQEYDADVYTSISIIL